MSQKITQQMSTAAYLEIHTADGRRQVPVGDQPVTIGRHPENGVVITDPVASRRHCVVDKTAQGWRVRDLNSSNGTKLNGLVIEHSRLLPGDIISIGATRIVLVVPAAKGGPGGGLDDFDGPPDLSALEGLGDEGSDADMLDEADVLSEDDLVEVEDDNPFDAP